MARTRVRRRRTVLVALVAVAGGVWAGPLRGGGNLEARPVAWHRYVVRPGDTVWGIAERYASSPDPRPLADSIASANDLDPSRLRPGQTLVIPSA